MKKFWSLLIGILSILVISSYFYVTEMEKSELSDFINDYDKLIKFNEFIGLALFVSISLILYQIYFRKKGQFGSILTKKIFIFITSIILIPSLINVKITNYFINKTVNQLFNPQIEELLENSFNIAEESVKYFSKDLSKKSVIAVEYLRLTGETSSLTDLKRIRSILDISGIGVYAKNGVLKNYDASNKNTKFLSGLNINIMRSLSKAGYYYEINRNSNGDYIFYYYASFDDGQTVLICQDAPDFIKIDNTKIIQNRELYRDLLTNRDNLKSVYTSTLIISVLLSIIIAVALSLFFAQFLIKRINDLLFYINQIKQGKFSKKEELIKGKDELSQLIVSFNEMSESLDKMSKIEKMQKDQILIYKNDLENIINNLSLSVIVYDDVFKIKNINNITASILGISLTDAMFKPLNEWKDDNKHLESLIDLLMNGISANYNDWEENILIRVKYTIKNLYIRTVKFNNNGKSEYITLISDVTNLIKAKQNQAWADIAKRLAHEIKNPLTPIVLSAERIEMKLMPKSSSDEQVFIQRLVKQIIIQVEDLKDLVNKFRDFANINKPSLSKIEMVHFFNQFLALYENINYIKFK